MIIIFFATEASLSSSPLEWRKLSDLGACVRRVAADVPTVSWIVYESCQFIVCILSLLLFITIILILLAIINIIDDVDASLHLASCWCILHLALMHLHHHALLCPFSVLLRPVFDNFLSTLLWIWLMTADDYRLLVTTGDYCSAV